MVYRLTVGGVMDKVMIDRVVTVLFVLLFLAAAITLHLGNQAEYKHHCPPERLTRLCVE
jgi:hypothetical protein